MVLGCLRIMISMLCFMSGHVVFGSQLPHKLLPKKKIPSEQQMRDAFLERIPYCMGGADSKHLCGHEEIVHSFVSKYAQHMPGGAEFVAVEKLGEPSFDPQYKQLASAASSAWRRLLVQARGEDEKKHAATLNVLQGLTDDYLKSPYEIDDFIIKIRNSVEPLMKPFELDEVPLFNDHYALGKPSITSQLIHRKPCADCNHKYHIEFSDKINPHSIWSTGSSCERFSQIVSVGKWYINCNKVLLQRTMKNQSRCTLDGIVSSVMHEMAHIGLLHIFSYNTRPVLTLDRLLSVKRESEFEADLVPFAVLQSEPYYAGHIVKHATSLLERAHIAGCLWRPHEQSTYNQLIKDQIVEIEEQYQPGLSKDALVQIGVDKLATLTHPHHRKRIECGLTAWAAYLTHMQGQNIEQALYSVTQKSSVLLQELQIDSRYPQKTRHMLRTVLACLPQQWCIDQLQLLLEGS